MILEIAEPFGAYQGDVTLIVPSKTQDDEIPKDTPASVSEALEEGWEPFGITRRDGYAQPFHQFKKPMGSAVYRSGPMEEVAELIGRHFPVERKIAFVKIMRGLFDVDLRQAKKLADTYLVGPPTS